MYDRRKLLRREQRSTDMQNRNEKQKKKGI